MFAKKIEIQTVLGNLLLSHLTGESNDSEN